MNAKEAAYQTRAQDRKTIAEIAEAQSSEAQDRIDYYASLQPTTYNFTMKMYWQGRYDAIQALYIAARKELA
jgi:hypothetical protein